jgi:hypothetical protein
MRLARRFEGLESWQADRGFAVELDSQFDADRLAARAGAFIDQIRSAVVSLSNNMAKGVECSAPKDFPRHLTIARRSSGSGRSMPGRALLDGGMAAQAHCRLHSHTGRRDLLTP